LVLDVVVLVVGLESLQEVSLLDILPLEFTTGMGGVVALRRRGGTVHGPSFEVLVLLQVERVGSLMVVTVVVFVEVDLVGKMVWLIGLIRCIRNWRTLRGIRFGNWLTLPQELSRLVHSGCGRTKRERKVKW
jgi:hypothetical protein